MLLSVMIANRNGSGDIRRFGTKRRHRHSRIAGRRLRELRRRDIPAAGPRWRNEWLEPISKSSEEDDEAGELHKAKEVLRWAVAAPDTALR